MGRTQKLPATSRPQPHHPYPRGGPLSLVTQEGLGGESWTQVSRGGEVWLPSDPGKLGLSWPPWFHPKPPCGRTPSRAERGLTAHPADPGTSGERGVGLSTPGHAARPRRAAPLCTSAFAPSRSRAGRVRRLRARPQEARLPAGRRGREHRLVDRRR